MQKRNFSFQLLLASVLLGLTSCNMTSYESQLPQRAQEFLKGHFNDIEIINVEETDNKMDYTIYLENGNKIDFDNAGDWEEVDFKRNDVPASFISILPASAVEYIQTNYTDESIHKIEKKNFGRKNYIYRIEFNKPNNIELSFTKEGELISDDPNGKKIPSEARAFIKNHYSDAEIVSIVDDVDGDFEITLDDKTELEFDRKGNWFYLNSKKKAFPESVLKLVPNTLVKYVEKNYPDQYIRRIEKKSYGFRIKLNKPNDVELSFSKNGLFLNDDKTNEIK